MTFIQTIAADLIRDGWDKLANYTVVFPMQRAGLYLTESLKQEMLRQQITFPVRMPEICTINHLADSLCPYYSEEEIFSICRLYRIYRKHTDPLFDKDDLRREGMTLDIFYSWGRQLLTDFSNVDMTMLKPETLFSNSASAHQLDTVPIAEETRQRLLALMGRPLENMEEDSIRCYIENLWKKLPDIYREFTDEMMDKHNVALPGKRLHYVVEHFDELNTYLKGRKIIFAGFNYLLAAECAFMDKCRQMGNTTFYWDENTHFSTNPLVYQFIRENIDVHHFTNALTPDRLSTQPYPFQIAAVACQSSASQAQYVHDWLLQHHKSGDKTAIVIADESMLEQVVYALPEQWSRQINITKGFPLRNTRICSDVVAWLSDSQHDRVGDETYADVINHLLNEVLVPVEKAERQRPEEDQPTWQHALVQESLYQTRRVLTRFRMLVATEISDYVTSFKTLRNILLRHLEMLSLPFHGEPVTDIQIIGVLETRLLDFDHLLVLNVEEGVLPSVPKDNSFIPYYLRKYYHMQTADEEALIYAYNFFRLFRRCKDNTLLFTNSVEGDNKRAMSRFLMQMLTSPDEFDVHKYTLIEPSKIRDIDTLELCDSEHVRFEGSSLSPSSINTFIECPMRFYLSRILGIQEPSSASVLYSSAEIGNLVHATLYAIYSHICGALTQPFTIQPEMLDPYLDDTQPLLSQMLVEAYVHENIAYRKNHGDCSDDYYVLSMHPLENKVIMEQVRKVLRRDQRQAQSLLEIVMLESDHRIELPVSLEDGTVRMVKVGGKMDRLDIVLENGIRTLRVLDYKSGTYKADKLSAISLDRILSDATCGRYINQTMLYSLVCVMDKKLNPDGLPVMPQLMYTQTEEGDMYVKIGTGPRTDKTPVTDFAKQYQTLYQRQLTDLITKIYNTSFTIGKDLKCAEDKCSSFCPFHTLCGREIKTY